MVFLSRFFNCSCTNLTLFFSLPLFGSLLRTSAISVYIGVARPKVTSSQLPSFLYRQCTVLTVEKDECRCPSNNVFLYQLPPPCSSLWLSPSFLSILSLSPSESKFINLCATEQCSRFVCIAFWLSTRAYDACVFTFFLYCFKKNTHHIQKCTYR